MEWQQSAMATDEPLAQWADTKDDIDRHVRRMLRFEKRGRIREDMTDEQICGVLSSGLLVWLFWQIAPQLLMWVIAAVRKRIWGPS